MLYVYFAGLSSPLSGYFMWLLHGADFPYPLHQCLMIVMYGKSYPTNLRFLYEIYFVFSCRNMYFFPTVCYSNICLYALWTVGSISCSHGNAAPCGFWTTPLYTPPDQIWYSGNTLSNVNNRRYCLNQDHNVNFSLLRLFFYLTLILSSYLSNI